MIGSFEDQPGDVPFEGVSRVAFDTDAATVTRYRFDAGAEFPPHRHYQSQVTLVLDGSATFQVDGEDHLLKSGGWATVDGGQVHGLRAGEHGATVLALVIPRREAREMISLEAG